MRILQVRDKRHADELLAAAVPDPPVRAFALTNLARTPVRLYIYI